MIWSATRPAIRAKLDALGLPSDADTVEKVRAEVRREIAARDGYPYWLDDDAVGSLRQRVATS